MLLDVIRRLTTFRLFHRIEPPRNVWQLIVWWEIRRIPYNLLVGLAGILTTILCLISGAIADRVLGVPIGIPGSPFFALVVVFAYGIMANICYTGGWITELIVEKVWQDEGRSFGAISFTLGIIFSIALTLLPGIFIVLDVAVNMTPDVNSGHERLSHAATCLA